MARCANLQSLELAGNDIRYSEWNWIAVAVTFLSHLDYLDIVHDVKELQRQGDLLLRMSLDAASSRHLIRL